MSRMFSCSISCMVDYVYIYIYSLIATIKIWFPHVLPVVFPMRCWGRNLHVQLTLAPNPSHLEAVDPVVLGMTRAKQDRIPLGEVLGVGGVGELNCWVYGGYMGMDQYLLIPFFREMNIHLPAILMFTRGTRFWHTAISLVTFLMGWNSTKKHIWNLDLTSSMMGMAELIWFENILWVSRSVVDLNFLS